VETPTTIHHFQFVSNSLNARKFVLSSFTDRIQFEVAIVKTHYQEREELLDGHVVIFRRGDAMSQGDRRIWQARFKIDGRVGFKTISLKTRNHADAVAKAKSTFFQLTQLVKDGATLENRTFEKAWQDWYSYMLGEGVWSEDRQRWHLSYFNRYFKAYFGAKKLDEITIEFANSYWNWRRRYWVDGEGINQMTYNRRRKGMKTHSSHNAKKSPSPKTLDMEQSALNQFFDWCLSTRRYIRYPIKMKVTGAKGNRVEGRRATFTNEEWRYLTRNLKSWALSIGKYSHDKLNEFHRHHRRQLRYYVLFLASTGIRSGTESLSMKWEDIEFREENLKIRIREATKMGKPRLVISQPNAVPWITEWKVNSRYSNDQDYVWYGMSKLGEPQKAATDLNKTFQAFLQTVEYKGRNGGLLFDADGKRRSLYSLRHFYATQRIQQGVSYEDLRRNMGTGIQQLVKHYDWATTEQRAKEITKTKFAQKRRLDVDQVLANLTDEQKQELATRLSNPKV
jgi:integrase